MPLKNIDYSKNVIYKIVCNDLNVKMCYVGHTTDFIRRKQKHKYNCTKENSNSYNLKVYKLIRDNGGWDNFSMVEIEKFSCKDNNEASARERYYYELFNANLNIQVPNRNQKESRKGHYEQNKDKIKEYYEQNKDKKKEYYQVNKTKISEYNKITLTCCCGSTFRKKDKTRHEKSIKHQEYISQLN